MAFDSSLVNFLTVGDFATDPSYELPLSQQLLTSSVYGLTFANAGSGSTYTLQTTGNMRAIMTLQQTPSYGVVISVPQVDGGLITRTLAGSGSISISDPTGAAGNPTLSVTPSSTVQLINTRVDGSIVGSARSTLNFISGTNIGINAVDTGTITDITFNSISDPLISSGPFVITQATAGLSGATNLGSLPTGYVFSTVVSGVSTLSTISSIPVPTTVTVSTTNATPTTLGTISIASNTCVTIDGIVSARNTSGTINNTCGGRFTCSAINTSGTVTLAATADVTVQSTSTATFNVVVSGTNLIIQVTGIAATDYSWSSSYTTLTV